MRGDQNLAKPSLHAISVSRQGKTGQVKFVLVAMQYITAIKFANKRDGKHTRCCVMQLELYHDRKRIR